MSDYHLHLHPHEPTPHGPPPGEYPVSYLERYVEAAAARGVTELAFTEHLGRCVESAGLLGPFWELEDDPRLADQTASRGGRRPQPVARALRGRGRCGPRSAASRCSWGSRWTSSRTPSTRSSSSSPPTPGTCWWARCTGSAAGPTSGRSPGETVAARGAAPGVRGLLRPGDRPGRLRRGGRARPPRPLQDPRSAARRRAPRPVRGPGGGGGRHRHGHGGLQRRPAQALRRGLPGADACCA